MSKLLSGLEAYGLSNLEDMEIFEKKQKEQEHTSDTMQHKVKEEDCLFDKAHACPVCGTNFKSKSVKTGKVRLVGSDKDLRPIYDLFEPLKYDVVMCPQCGYTALERFFNNMMPYQKKAIIEKISSTFKLSKEEKMTYSFEDALERYKMALVNAIVKTSKASEKGYICLKTAWLIRSEKEKLPKDAPDYEKRKAELDAMEEEFMQNALEGFRTAVKSEGYPMCGMDEGTVDYLLASLETRLGDCIVAWKLIGKILVSPTASVRLKDRARDLKEEVAKKRKQMGNE